MLDQSRRRPAEAVLMLYRCFCLLGFLVTVLFLKNFYIFCPPSKVLFQVQPNPFTTDSIAPL